MSEYDDKHMRLMEERDAALARAEKADEAIECLEATHALAIEDRDRLSAKVQELEREVERLSNACENLVVDYGQLQIIESELRGSLAAAERERDEARLLKAPVSKEKLLQAQMAASVATRERDAARAEAARLRLLFDDLANTIERWRPVIDAAKAYRAWADRVGLLTANCPADVAVELCDAIDTALSSTVGGK